MRKLVVVHRYLSCFVAPAMLFFAISGAWQAFRLQDTRKDGSYVAPVVLQRLSEIHKADEVSGVGGWLFRGGQVALAGAFCAVAITGLVLASQRTRPRWLFWVTLGAGVVTPVLLSLLRSG
jgi:hypothetical protein